MATLLLADDSVTIQRVIELTFADEDVDVVSVGDGDQAIERVEASPPDIVLADVGMPGKNGYEVARYIKGSPRLAHIPVVLLTGAFEPVDQERATEAGCDGVLSKPFEPQTVIGRVRELLSRAPAPARFEPEPVPAPPAPPQESGDDYFDRLDAAFANLPPPSAKAEVDDWDLPASPGTKAMPMPDSSAKPPAPPPLADAFAALLAAEQDQSGAASWPSSAGGAPAVTDELVEEVTRRVLERLSDRTVRDTVADIVSSVAERLVREEIERIKASIA